MKGRAKEAMLEWVRGTCRFAKQITATRVWLDDQRPMPEGYDTHVYTATEAINLLKSGAVTAISLDHDLGGPENGTGYDVAKWIEQAAYSGAPRIEWQLHSSNPSGRANMRAALEQAEKFWSENEQK